MMIKRLLVLGVMLLAACVSPGTSEPRRITDLPTRPPTITPVPTRQPPTATTLPTATTAPTLAPTATPLPVTGDVTFEVVGQTGGDARHPYLVGRTLYIAEGPRMVILDVSDPTTPEEIGRSDVLGMGPFIVRDGIAYVMHRGLTVLDVRDVDNITVITRLERAAPYTQILLRGDLLYAGGSQSTRSGFINVIDISNPAAPQIVGRTTVPTPIDDMALVNGTLYLLTGTNFSARSISAVDVSDPARPIDRGEVLSLLEIDARIIRAVGQFLMVPDSSALRVYSVVNPLEPLLTTRVDNGGIAYDLLVTGEKTLYTIGLSPAGGYVPFFDVTTLEQPISGEPSTLRPSRLWASGDWLVVDEEGLFFYNIAEPAAPEQVLRYQPLDVGQVTASEDIIYAVSPGGSLLNRPIQDETQWRSDADPGRIVTLALPDLEILATTEGAPDAFTTHEGVVYASWLDGSLSIVQADATVTELPRSFGEDMPLGFPPDFSPAIVDNRAYLPGMNTLSVVNLQTGEVVVVEDSAHTLATDGERLITSASNNSVGSSGVYPLRIYDISEEQPERVDFLRLDQPARDIAVRDGVIAVASQDFSIEEPQEHLLLLTVDPFEVVAEIALSVRAVTFLDNTTLMALTTDGTLYAIDVTAPATPQILGAYQLPTDIYNFPSWEYTSGLTVLGDRVIVGGSDVGVLVLQVAQ